MSVSPLPPTDTTSQSPSAPRRSRTVTPPALAPVRALPHRLSDRPAARSASRLRRESLSASNLTEATPAVTRSAEYPLVTVTNADDITTDNDVNKTINVADEANPDNVVKPDDSANPADEAPPHPAPSAESPTRSASKQRPMSQASMTQIDAEILNSRSRSKAERRMERQICEDFNIATGRTKRPQAANNDFLQLSDISSPTPTTTPSSLFLGPEPSDNFIVAVIATLLGGVVFGTVALVYSLKSSRAIRHRDYEQAEQYRCCSLGWSIISLVFTTAIVVAVLFYFLAVQPSADSNQ